MALVQVEAIVERVIRDYERLGPHALVPRVLAHRRWLHEVMQGRQPPKYAARLHLSAARLCGVLAVIALDMQQRDVARAYALEAFQLADLVDDADTQAWVRATQSLVEYYIGDYEQALFYASAGRQLASTGSQAIRLAINGEARAHARLGNHRAAASAVDRALQGLADQPKVNEVSCGLSLTPYCAARVSSNAATAYLLLGNAEQVMIHGQAALAVFDGSELRGPQALTRLDMAMALVHDTHPQPERAAGLAEDAVAVDGAGVFASVAQRASEFLIAVAEWHDVPAIRDVTARVHDLAGRNRRSA
jgi:tetratricopeptide (TPR) repeat protein